MTTNPNSPPLLTIKEAAEYLRLSPFLIRKLMRDGRLEGYRPTARRIMFSHGQLHAFLNKSNTQPQAI